MEALYRQGSSLLISRVTPESLDSVWQQLLPQIEKGLLHGEGDCLTSKSIYESIKSNRMGMWVIHDPDVKAAVIFSILEHPNKKTIFVEMLAGKDIQSWINELQDAARQYQKEIGADTIEASCRKGLLKILSDWKTKAYLLELN